MKINIQILFLYIVFLSIPFFSVKVIKSGMSIFRIDWFFISIFIFIFIINLFINKEKLNINNISKFVLVLNFVAVISFLNIYYNPYFSISNFTTKWVQLILVSLMFFSISSVNIKEKEIKNVLRLWVIIALIVATYGIYQAFARNLGLPLDYLSYGMTGGTFGFYTRPSSFFSEPSYLGSYLIGPLFLLGTTIFFKISGKYFFSKLKNLFIFSVLSIAFILSGSFAAYLTIIITLGVAFLSFRLSYKAKMLKFLFIFLLSVALAIIFFKYVLNIDFFTGMVERSKAIYSGISQGGGGGSFFTRLSRVFVTLQVWYAHPVIGVGLNNVSPYAIGYGMPEWYLGIGKAGANHTVFAQVLAEMGIIGFFTVVSLVVVTLSTLWKGMKYVKGTGWEFILLAFFFIIWSDIINSNFTHMIIHPQRWLDLSICTLLLVNLKKLSDK